MNNYSDVTLTIDDLTSDLTDGGFYRDERGSTFTNCVFQNTAGDAMIEHVDFSYALFTNCTWSNPVKDCLFVSAEGAVPGICNVVFDSAPPDKWLPADEINTILRGTGEETEWDFARIDETAVRNAFENTPINMDDENPEYLTADDYTLTMGKAHYDCPIYAGEVSRTEWLAVATFEISTDAIDSYQPYDGIPDIPANGTSSCTITVTAKDRAGDTKDDDTTVVVFKTTRGSLSSLQVTMTDGVAETDLTSVTETTIATVTAEIEGEEPLTIDIQFAPTT